MPKSHHPYPRELKARLVEMVRAGRTPEELAEKLEPTAQSIRNWVAQAERDVGRRSDGLTTEEREELRRLRREVKALREGARDSKESRGLVRSGDRLDSAEGFEFVRTHRARHRIVTQCRVLGVSRSGYYAWLTRPASARARTDAVQTKKLHAIHACTRGTYGVPRVHAELRSEGVRVGRKRVARLMRAAGLAGVSRRKRAVTTVRDRDAHLVPDLVTRIFTAAGPNRLWVADITYIPTWAGFLFLAVVLGAWSRRIVGWAMATHLRTELVLDALIMAVAQRSPTQVIHHSDQDCQYTSIAFGQRCREMGVRPSTGSVGDAYDNAMCESFFATLECELLDRHRFQTQLEARLAVFEFIEGWYNPHRRHSALEYESPVNYERKLLSEPKCESVHLSAEPG